MKKIFLVIVAAMLVTTNVNAQEFKRHEFGISFGAFSNSNWIDVFEDALITTMTGTSVKYENEDFTGPFSAEYFYHINKIVGLGGIAVYGDRNKDVVSGSDVIGKGEDFYLTLMPAAKFEWLRSKHVGLYSKVGLGATLRSESIDYNDGDNYDDSTIHFNYQLSLLGVEAGSEVLRGFIELGVGEQGVAQIGVRCKF